MVNQDKIEIVAELKDLMSGQFKAINEQVNKLENSLSNVGKNRGGSGGGFWNMDTNMMAGVTAGNLLANGIQRAAGAVMDFGKESIEAYSSMEGYEARLTTLLGDRKTALIAISGYQKDAAHTPFDLPALVQGNSLLIGAGVSAKDARADIMNLGNAIAATGGGSDELSRMAVNLAQIKSIGKASALDVKQFMYANIPIYDLLAKSMNKPISKIKEMDITYKDLTKALSEARQEGGKFYMGLENASNSLKGLKSNLDDTIMSLKANIGENFADVLKDSIRGLLPMLDQMNEQMGSINKTSRTLKEAGLGFSLGDGPVGKGEMTALQIEIDKAVNRASISPIQAMKSDSQLNNVIASLSREYSTNKDMYDITGEGEAPDLEKYRRQIALLKDGLDTVRKLAKGDTPNANVNNGGEKKVSDLEKVAKANRPTQTYINIENLVRELSNTVSSPKEALQMSAEQVAKTLISVVNDVSVLNQGN